MATNVKIFHLWLNTKLTTPATNLAVPITNVSATTLNNVSWMVDFDSLFRGWNKKYKRCNVKFQLNSDTWTASGTDWETYNGILAFNLPSDAGSSTTNGTALGLIQPVDCPTTGTSTHCYFVSTLSNQQGVDILVPQSNQIFTISFLRNTTVMNLITTSLPDYQILFQFELSEPIEEK